MLHITTITRLAETLEQLAEAGEAKLVENLGPATVVFNDAGVAKLREVSRYGRHVGPHQFGQLANTTFADLAEFVDNQQTRRVRKSLQHCGSLPIFRCGSNCHIVSIIMNRRPSFVSLAK